VLTVLVAMLVVLLCTTAYSRCTHHVQGKIVIDDSCTTTLLEMCCWNEGIQDWVVLSSGVFQSGDYFHFTGQFGFSNVRFKSNNYWLDGLYYLLGCSGQTTQVGTLVHELVCVDPE